MATSRGGVVAAAVGLALVGVALLGSPSDSGPPLDPRSDAPDGTSALVTFLDQLGGGVDLSQGLPTADDDVALLLVDRLDQAQADEVEAWVREGGTLVVTDPRSPFTPAGLDGFGTLDGDEVLPRGVCTLDALADVDEVDVGAATQLETGSGYGSCVGSRDHAFVVASALGGGDVVALGGPDFLTNERLDEADNAVLAAALLAPSSGTRVRVVDAPAPAGSGERSLADLVSDGVRRAGLQLGIAFLVYALWRAIRLGRVVREDQPVEIAGSSLVSATGRLVARGRAPGEAAEVLRTDLRRALRSRLGVAPSATNEALSHLVVERTGVDASVAAAAVGDQPVQDENELLAVARAVTSIHQEVLR